jgi:hypothetical protein
VKYLCERYDCRSPAPSLAWSVAVSSHERSSRQNCAYRFSLYPDAPPMNDTKRFNSQAFCFRQIFFDNPLHIARWNAVKVEHVRYRYANRVGKRIAARIERHTTPS